MQTSGNDSNMRGSLYYDEISPQGPVEYSMSALDDRSREDIIDLCPYRAGHPAWKSEHSETSCWDVYLSDPSDRGNQSNNTRSNYNNTRSIF